MMTKAIAMSLVLMFAFGCGTAVSTPTATSVPEDTPTPTATSTPTLTPTFTPTPSPIPTSTPKPTPPDRETRIPSGAVKMTPLEDLHPPKLHSDLWEEPVPLSGPVNTAGAEDSPFMLPDGNTLFFFFTPDVTVPPEKQLLDEVTGIYVSTKHDGIWQEPERVVLGDDISLDGCEFVQGDVMWFCSARAGYTGVNWFAARMRSGDWTNWEYVGDQFDPSYKVGELHFSSDWAELYYHSDRDGGKGENDIWVTRKLNDEWQQPSNVEIVNTEKGEGWPFLSHDGRELWFNRWYQGTPGIFRSKMTPDGWGEPELVLSSFAGEPTLDAQGNIYFVHHFFNEGNMIEADIYIARKK
jgi:hypothetical protein